VLSFKEVKAQIAAIGGLSVSKREGEFRVNFKGGSEATAYYTNDPQDAIGTAKAIARNPLAGKTALQNQEAILAIVGDCLLSAELASLRAHLDRFPETRVGAIAELLAQGLRAYQALQAAGLDGRIDQ
jgi:hypothetical protein